MKIFCAYAFTGEDKPAVEARMRRVCNALKASGHDVYCNMFAPDYEQLKGVRQIFAHAFAALQAADVVIPVVASDRRSEGQLIEIGAALVLGKPVYLLQHVSATEKSYIQDLATKTVVWHTEDELAAEAARIAKDIARPA